MNKRVLLGLSGGVDSAVAASLLLEQGYEVYAHWLDIGLGGREDAERVAAERNIPFSVGDIREALEANVMQPFADEYYKGRTPVPCALCNPTVKFPALFARAGEVGADWVATGHYAKLIPQAEGGLLLARGEHRNDQAYLLSRLPKAWLPHLLFPIGSYEKTQVRALAHRFGIPVADKKDSMEICFIPDNDYGAWLDRRGETPPPGDFCSRAGTKLGGHKGIHHYTIGQRRGLGIPAEARLFVSEICPATNTVVLSDGSDLMADIVWGEDLNLYADLQDGQPLSVRLRHSKQETPARFFYTEHGGKLLLEQPARAPTPGQLAVFYQGDAVLGSMWIESAHRVSEDMLR